MSAASTVSSPGETFTASRWTRGNLFFPIRIVVTPLHVSRVKPRLFGTNEESIAISQVASVGITTVIGWLIGVGLDKWLHTTWLYIVGLLLGIAAGFVQLIRAASKNS